jgi:hypothetical protein
MAACHHQDRQLAEQALLEQALFCHVIERAHTALKASALWLTRLRSWT